MPDCSTCIGYTDNGKCRWDDTFPCPPEGIPPTTATTQWDSLVARFTLEDQTIWVEDATPSQILAAFKQLYLNVLNEVARIDPDLKIQTVELDATREDLTKLYEEKDLLELQNHDMANRIKELIGLIIKIDTTIRDSSLLEWERLRKILGFIGEANIN